MAFSIYPFGLKGFSSGNFENDQEAKNVLGGKGAGLHWMNSHSIPVPPGFVIPTSAWSEYKQSPAYTMTQINSRIDKYLDALVSHFGYMPLLSVRSGARVSCPGMMDTILNVGIDNESYGFWENTLGIACVTNSRHRLIQMFASVVKGVDKNLFLDKTWVHNEDNGTEKMVFLNKSISESMAIYEKETGEKFPQFRQQLLDSIEAVFKSWDNERAVVYRKMHGYEDSWGTAVTVQAMVFGNLNDQSGTGVLFTRNCDTGVNQVSGEFLVNAQGEDVVAGIRTPMPLGDLLIWNQDVGLELLHAVGNLEKTKREVQDVEFTIQDGKLYFLQTRDAKRTPRAAVAIALDMVKEGLIGEKVALSRVTPRQLDESLMAVIDPKFKIAPDFTSNYPACSGVVSGVPVFSSKDALKSKVPCILITEETTPEDIAGMNAAVGIITMTGGLTSHAAVVARGMNKPCITGVGVKIEHFEKMLMVGMDGATGRIWSRAVPTTKGDTKRVEAFKQMACKAYNATPIVFEKPSIVLPQALLYVGGAMFDELKAWTLITEVAKMCKKLYVDFSMDSQHDAEQKFFSMFQGADIKKGLISQLENQSLGCEIILVGATSKKLASVGSASDLESMILAKSGLIVSGEMSEAMKKVVKWKQSEGVSVMSFGLQNNGAASFVSYESLLQMAGK